MTLSVFFFESTFTHFSSPDLFWGDDDIVKLTLWKNNVLPLYDSDLECEVNSIFIVYITFSKNVQKRLMV